MAGVSSGLFSGSDYLRDSADGKAYSAVRHLAHSVSLNHEPASRFMAMFAAYFDESGTHEGSPAVAVAGFISTVEQWQCFEKEWQDILNEAGIEFFHMADHQNRHGPYRDWDDLKHRRILERFIITARLRCRVPIGASVPREDYRKAFGISPPFSPYTFCALQCLAQVGRWAHDYNHQNPIAYVLESGAGYNKELGLISAAISGNERRKHRYRFDSLSLGDKRELKPLQASDIIAYELYKEMVNRVIPGKQRRRLRRSAIELLKGKPRDYTGHYTEIELKSADTYLPEDD